MNDKGLILTHKEFAETIIERLQDKIKGYEEDLKKVKTETKWILLQGKIKGLNEAIEEMEEFIRQLKTWYE